MWKKISIQIQRAFSPVGNLPPVKAHREKPVYRPAVTILSPWMILGANCFSAAIKAYGCVGSRLRITGMKILFALACLALLISGCATDVGHQTANPARNNPMGTDVGTSFPGANQPNATTTADRSNTTQ